MWNVCPCFLFRTHQLVAALLLLRHLPGQFHLLNAIIKLCHHRVLPQNPSLVIACDDVPFSDGTVSPLFIYNQPYNFSDYFCPGWIGVMYRVGARTPPCPPP